MATLLVHNYETPDPFGDIASTFIDRSNKLADTASERQYEQSAAEAASKRRMGELAEADRLNLISQAIHDNIPGVTAKDTPEQVLSKRRTEFTSRADAGAKGFITEFKSARNEEHQAMRQASAVAGVTGTPRQKIEALRNTLANASVIKDMPDEALKELKKFTQVGSNATDEQIEAKVAAATDYMQQAGGFWWKLITAGFGKSKTAAANQAQTFFDTYQQELAKAGGPSQTVGIQVAMQQLNAATQHSRDVAKEGFAHARSGILSPSVQDELISTLGTAAVPTNPADALKYQPKPDAAKPPGSTAAPPPAAATSSEDASTDQPVPGLIQRIGSGVMSAREKLGALSQRTRDVQNQIPGALGDVVGGYDPNNIPGTIPPTAAEVMSNRSRIRGSSGLPVGGITKPALIPLRPGEAEKLRTIALKQPGENAQTIAQHERELMSGAASPERIAATNRLILAMRRQDSGLSDQTDTTTGNSANAPGTWPLSPTVQTPGSPYTGSLAMPQ